MNHPNHRFLALISILASFLLMCPSYADQPSEKPPDTDGDPATATGPIPGLRWSPEGALLPPLPSDPELRQQAYQYFLNKDKGSGGSSGDEPLNPETSIELSSPRILPPVSPAPHNDNELESQGGFSWSNQDKSRPTFLDFPGGYEKDYFPPSPDIAVGNDWIIQVVNLEISIYDKCGNLHFQQNIANWLSETTYTLVHAKVIWNKWYERFALVITGYDPTFTSSVVYLLAPAGDDPTGSWYQYSLATHSLCKTIFADAGTDPFRIYITANQYFGGVDIWGPRLWIVRCEELFNGGTVPYVYREDLQDPCCRVFPPFLPPPSAFSSWICTPSIYEYDNEYWLVNSIEDGSDNITVRRITFSWALTPEVDDFLATCDIYDEAPPMFQPDSKRLASGNCRFINAAMKKHRIWAAMTVRANWGGSTDRAAIRVFQINTNPPGPKMGLDPLAIIVASETTFGQEGYDYAYPTVDINPDALALVTFCRSGLGLDGYPRVSYVDVNPDGTVPPSGEKVLHVGEKNFFDPMHAGTYTDPYRWGRYCGIQLDPWDEAALWFTGPYGWDDGSAMYGRWATHIGAMSFEGPPLMEVECSSVPGYEIEITGEYGGPFYPNGWNFYVENNGGAALYYYLPDLPNWLEMPVISFDPGNVENSVSPLWKIRQGSKQLVYITVSSFAETLPPGIYDHVLEFISCGGGTVTYDVRLIIGDDSSGASCAGAFIELLPSGLPLPGTVPGNVERGVEIMPLRDFDLKCVGIQLASEVPEVLRASLYRGPPRSTTLLWQEDMLLSNSANNTHYFLVEPNEPLTACETYELAFEIGDVDVMRGWAASQLGTLPFVADGVIRVESLRKGSTAGNILLDYDLVGESSALYPFSSELVRNLSDEYSYEQVIDRGIYVTSLYTIATGSIGIYGDFAVGEELTAAIYETNNAGKRDAVMTLGSLIVAASGLQWHDIPVYSVLTEGVDYDLAVMFNACNFWEYQTNGVADVTYPVDGVFEVLEGEEFGRSSTDQMPRLRIFYEGYPDPCDCPGKAMCLVDLGNQSPMNSSSVDSLARGVYFTPLFDQPLFGVSWKAALPKSSPVIARLFNTEGGVRDSLLARAYIRSGSEEDIWHTIPLDAQLLAGSSYDLEIQMFDVTSWEHWNAATLPFPIEVASAIRLTGTEIDGVPGQGDLLQLRLHTLPFDPISEIGQETPRISSAELRVYPSPFNASANLEIDLPFQGQVNVVIYDARGRIVRELMTGHYQAGFYPLKWDGKNNAGSPVGSGLYLANLKVDGKVIKTEKMVLLK